jgi:hypothetical protein
MSLSSSLLLVGGDAGGVGVVSLYRTDDNALLATWPQPKPIWAVAVSPDGRLAAVGGANRPPLQAAPQYGAPHPPMSLCGRSRRRRVGL